jgi:hypothetical protein
VGAQRVRSMENEIEVIPEGQDTRERCLIYSSECFSCPHVIAGADATSADKECHYSKGNRYCPAAQVIFVVSGAAFSLASKLHHARDTRDAEAEAAILIEAAKLNEYARERFYAAVENPKILDAFNNTQ